MSNGGITASGLYRLDTPAAPMPVMNYQPTNDFVGPPLPDNYQAPIFYQQPQITPQQFNNTGRLVDPTLLAQQGILGRQPVQYEPIIQPSTYQNFYANAQTMYPSVGGLLVPDYATKAQVFRQDFADAQAARDGEAGSVDATSTGDASSSVGGYGQSGLVGQDGGFVGDLGQGIDTPATQDVAFNVLAATENPVVQAAVPGAALANLAAGAYLDQQVSNINDSFNALDAGNTPGIATVSDNAGNVASFSTPGTVALSDANEFGGIATGLGIGDTGSTAPGAGGIADTGTVDVGGQTVSNTGTIAAQDAANFGPAFGLSPAPAPAPSASPLGGKSMGSLSGPSTGDSTGVTVSPVSDYGNVTGTPLGTLGEAGGIGSGVSVSPVGDYGSVVGTDLGLLGTNSGTGSGYGGGYAGDGVGAVGAAGGFAPGISGDTFGGEGDSADSAGGGGGAGGGGCVIATHAVAHGSFTPREKRKAVLWCTKTLHNRWWGETIRKGYRWHGNRAIAAGRAHEYYEEFRDFIRFATGAKRNTHTAKVFAWRSLQFFVTGLFLKG